MERREAVRNLWESAALWSVRQCPSAHVVRAASDSVATGLDTPALRQLATMTMLAPDGDDRAIADVLSAAIEELELPPCPPDSPIGQEAALIVFASRALAGDVAPKDLASWVHDTFGHALPTAKRLADLHGAYVVVEPAGGAAQIDTDRIDQDVLAEALRILRRD